MESISEMIIAEFTKPQPFSVYKKDHNDIIKIFKDEQGKYFSGSNRVDLGFKNLNPTQVAERLRAWGYIEHVKGAMFKLKEANKSIQMKTELVESTNNNTYTFTIHNIKTLLGEYNGK